MQSPLRVRRQFAGLFHLCSRQPSQQVSIQATQLWVLMDDGRVGPVAQDQARRTAPGFPARLLVEFVQPLDRQIEPPG